MRPRTDRSRHPGEAASVQREHLSSWAENQKGLSFQPRNDKPTVNRLGSLMARTVSVDRRDVTVSKQNRFLSLQNQFGQIQSNVLSVSGQSWLRISDESGDL